MVAPGTVTVAVDTIVEAMAADFMVVAGSTGVGGASTVEVVGFMVLGAFTEVEAFTEAADAAKRRPTRPENCLGSQAARKGPPFFFRVSLGEG